MRGDVIDFGPSKHVDTLRMDQVQMPDQLGRLDAAAAGVRKHALPSSGFADPMQIESRAVCLLTATRKSASQAAGANRLPGGHDRE